MPKATNQAAQQRLVQEHDELEAMIGDLRTWLAEVAELGIPHFGELGSRLRPLRDKLCEHFAHEEAGGYLADAVAVAPELVTTVDELLAQHDVFKNRLDALICRLRESEVPFDCWQAACETFESLCADIARHEQTEMEIQIGPGNSNVAATNSNG